MITEKIITLDGMKKVYSVRNVIEHFDDYMVEKIINNKNSYFYNQIPNMGIDDVKAILTEIFLSRSARVWMCSGFWRDGLRFGALGSHNYLNHFPQETLSAMPNPLTFCFRDVGLVYRELRSAILNDSSEDILRVIDFAGKTINVQDVVAMELFTRYLASFDCIELANGEIVNAYDAVEFFKKGGRSL